MLDVKKVAIVIAIPLIILSILIYNGIKNKDEIYLKMNGISINKDYDNYVLSKQKFRFEGKNQKMAVIFYYNNEYDFNGYYPLYVEAYIKKNNIVKFHQISSFRSIEELEKEITSISNDFNLKDISENYD